jgi:hypothetical protein
VTAAVANWVIAAVSLSIIVAVKLARSLTFTTSNWSRPQTITITAVNDPDMDNETVAIRHVISGGGYGSVSSHTDSIVTTTRNSIANDNSFVIRIIVILSSNRNRLWTAPVASGKGE